MGIVLLIPLPGVDVHTKQWISTSPSFLTSTLVLYIGFHIVYNFLPNFNQSNFLQRLTFWKNCIVAASNLSVAFYFSYRCIQLKYHFLCMPSTGDSLDNKMKEVMFFFLMVKLMEMSDTILTCLRTGTYSTFLFVHHGLMFIISWLGLRYLPSGTSSVLALISTLVHFGVYLLPVLGQFGYGTLASRVYLQDCINQTQFLLIIVVCGAATYIRCGYPLFATCTIGFFTIVLLAQFPLLRPNC